ncbi:MAG: isoprenylcysteine carboxylmethyltransferase family protein [Ignavibacteriales bacterium]|nr:isoprenylcysteine carboxylmethyltransferase family protein [Ignavibacteriales bacterium]
MDPINILVLVALVFLMSANYAGSQKSLKGKMGLVARRASGWLQSVPPNVLAFSTLLQFLGCFPIIDTWFLGYTPDSYVRILFFVLFLLFSFTQIRSYKTLKESYSTDMLIYKNHRLVKNELYRFIRHPQYLSQLLADLCVGVALLSSPVIILTLLVGFPLLILRAKKEEEMLASHFKGDFDSYKKSTGFFLPFI